jgi:photosystem II PsbU protein
MFRLLFIGLLAMLAPQGISAFSPTTGLSLQRLPAAARTIAVDVAMSSEVDRRTVFANAAAFAGMLLAPSPSFGLNTTPADNEIVKEQRTITSKLDINNAAVADYMQFPGMYPTIGGKIANNGPYNSVRDVYKLKLLSKAEKAAIKKYESKLTATPSTGLDTMRGRDPYRRSFNK